MGISREQGLKASDDAPLPDEKPFRLQGDWDRKMEYLSATALSLGASAAVRIPKAEGLSIIVDAGWEHGLGIRVLPGSDRLSAALRFVYVLRIPTNRD